MLEVTHKFLNKNVRTKLNTSFVLLNNFFDVILLWQRVKFMLLTIS